MKRSPSPEFPEMKDNAYRVRAQVDVLMPGNENPQSPVKDYENDGTLLETFGKPDGGSHKVPWSAFLDTILKPFEIDFTKCTKNKKADCRRRLQDG